MHLFRYLLRVCRMIFSRKAREFFYSHLSTDVLIHNALFCRFSALFFLLYRVNEIAPLFAFLSTVLLTFPRFFTFCRLCDSISVNFPFPNKKLSTPPLGADNFSLFLFDLRLFVLNWLVFAYRMGFRVETLWFCFSDDKVKRRLLVRFKI